MILQPCPNCGRSLRAQDDFAGRLVRCPGCGQTLRLQGTSQDAISSVIPVLATAPVQPGDFATPVGGLPPGNRGRGRRWFQPGSKVLVGILLGTLAGALVGSVAGLIAVQVHVHQAPPPPGPPRLPDEVPVLSASPKDETWPWIVGATLFGIALGIFGGALTGAALSDPVPEGTPWAEGATGGALTGGTLGTFGCMVVLALTAIAAFFVALCGGFSEALSSGIAGQEAKGVESQVNRVLLNGTLIALGVLAGTAAVGTVLGGLGAAIGGVLARMRHERGDGGNPLP